MTELLNRELLALDPHDPQRYLDMAKETEGCISFTIGEPDFGISDVVNTNVTKALQLGLTHYAPTTGDPGMRLSVAEFEKRSLGIDYASNEVIMTVGATEALAVALLGVLCPGDEVVIPRPCISLYETLVRLGGGTPVFLDTTDDDFQISAEKLAAAITDKTKAIVLNSPNNPTGVALTAASMQNVHDAVAGKPIFVICDNVYNRVVYDGPVPFFASFTDLKKQILVAQSFSNTYAMAGFRAGYLLGEASVIEKLIPLHKALVYAPVNFIQPSCIQAVHADYMGMVWAYDSRRKFLCERLEQMGLEFVAPQGGFFVFPSIKKFGLDSETFCTRLIKEQQLAVLPGICFGSDDHVRISYSVPMGNLRAGLIRLEKFLQSL